MDSEITFYRQLQEHLDKLPIGYPKTNSGVEIRILQLLFTPVEVKVALCLSLGNASVETVRKRLDKKFGISHEADKIATILHDMFMKGSINRSNKEPFKYSNAMLAIGMFEHQLGDLSKEMLELVHQYFDEGFNDEFFRSSLPQLRTSPHMKAIVPEFKIATYDNIRKIVEKTDKSIQVANCVCKEGEAILGDRKSVV